MSAAGTSPPRAVSPIPADQAPLLARSYYADGAPSPIVAALAHVPELLDVAMPFVAAALGESFVSARLKEIAILRASAVLGCHYCVRSHTVVALDEGLSRAEVVALCRDEPAQDDPDVNDEMRGHGNFAKVVDAIPKLLERGIGVRIATTVDDPATADAVEMERLCELHRSLGVPDCDHVVRPIIRRGRAATGELGRGVGFEDFEPELTITADGAFSTPFGPTVTGGRLDTDLLVTRATSPLRRPVDALMRIAGEQSAGADARIGIR